MSILSDERYRATIHTERELLGGLIIEAATLTRDAVIETSHIISPSDFIDMYHGKIFSAMLTCNVPVSYLAIAREMDRNGHLEKGDCSYLIKLVAHCICTPFDIVYYANLIKEYSDQRRGIEVKRIQGAK